MDATLVSRILSLVPDRAARAPSGLPFLPEAGALRHAERVKHLAGFLHWLSPLTALSKEDQKIFGVLNAAGRAVHAGEDEEEEALPLEEGGADALEYMEAETAAGPEPARALLPAAHETCPA